MSKEKMIKTYVREYGSGKNHDSGGNFEYIEEEVPAWVKSARRICAGCHDDFYNYLHLSPTALKKHSIERAHEAATAGIHALGLRNTTAHVELMKIDDEWKLIEIGPRVGGFRDKLHSLSCGIDHSLNDILIRFPKKPLIPKKCKGFAATLKWYPKSEGKIIKLKGIKKCQELKSFVAIKLIKKIGDTCQFAKNGGKAVFTITLYNTERSKLLADIRRIEQLVDVQVQ